MVIALLPITGEGSKRMKSTVLLIFLLALSLSLSAQPIGMDTLKNQRILLGKVSQANIRDSIWYRENYNAGVVTPGLLEKIDSHSDSTSVEIYFGTWCDDSQYWVPAFIGLMDKTNMGGRIQLIAVPRSKKTKETEKLGEIIERVPTFVFWRNGMEIGRIVESPEETLAKDMINILKR